MRILEVLSENKYISGNEIGKALGISRAAVHKQVKNLISNGYVIVSSCKGYKLVKNSYIFNVNEMMTCLNCGVSVCSTIKHYKRINSTQIKIKQLAEAGAPEGLVVFADEQSSAYGRMKRQWSSEKGGMWFSVLLKPRVRPDEAPKLALLASIAVRRVFCNSYGIMADIKWPNDVLFDDRKICGIIIEMSAEQDIVNWIAAGIGININNKLSRDLENEAVSLKEITGESVNLSEFTAFFFNEFQNVYTEFQKDGFGKFINEYNEYLAFKGENIKIDDGYDIISGVNEGINESGYLKVKTNNGIRNIVSGTLRRS